MTEVDYDPSQEAASLSFLPQKWDDSSNQYRDDAPAFNVSISKMRKMSLGGYYKNTNIFCEGLTVSNSHLEAMCIAMGCGHRYVRYHRIQRHL